MINDSAACLLAEAQAAWATTGRAVPAASRVVIGAVAYDDCCEDGLLLVSIDSFVWFNPFPLEQAGQIPGPGPGPPPPRCVGSLGAYVTLHVGVCVPVLDARGNAPSPTAEAAAMAEVVDLVEVLMRALVCPGHECWSVGQAALAGTEGGCLVGLINVKLDGDCDCTP